jgi:pilus assembly protein Flp/PilA
MKELRRKPAADTVAVAQRLPLPPACRGKRGALINQMRRCRNKHRKRDAIPRGRVLMSMLLNFVNSVVRDEEGQDLLEYALLVALIALVAIGAVGLAGNSVSTIFTNIATRLTTAAGA